MKKLLFSSLFFFLLAIDSFSQTLSGIWEGDLQVMGQSLPLVFNFQEVEQEWKGSMDSPKQGARGIAMSKVLFDGTMLYFEIGDGVIVYEGLFIGDTVQGTFKQSGMVLPLDLKRSVEEAAEKKEIKRPQRPQAPFNYDSFETNFSNEDGAQLKGTVTKPYGEGPFPAVILVTGSGPQNRNSEILGHEPFWVMADYLTQNGIVVFRYDERGVGESEGDFSNATTNEFFRDAQKALLHLPTFDFIDSNKLGIIGHSEGGLIAWMLAADAKKTGLSFAISLAGPVVTIPELMKKQTEEVSRSSGNPKALIEQQVKINSQYYQMIAQSKGIDDAKSKVRDMVNEVLDSYDLSPEIKQQQVNTLIPTLEKSLNPWFYNFIRTNPESYISEIQIPVFAAFGGKDVQVNAAQNANRLLELYKGKEELLELKVFPELNHLFQKANTGSVSEYAEIEESFNLEVLNNIAAFIHSFKK
ncbi:alpha/beta hydrolase family protein [Fontibacter flavus]|uniref:Alpha/beta hydrolase family protein n=1 Tax=Fontibacter flavus TaxID=654838 RepID=A0ABV6FU52_9BACT